jgi:protein TonB
MTTRKTAQVKITDSDRFGMTFFLAVIFHGIVILGITFSISPAADDDASPALDIILVQTKAPDEAEKADYLAQISQKGGGDSDHKARPKELFSAPTLSEDPGLSEQTNVQQIKKQKLNEQVALLTQTAAEYDITTEENPLKADDDMTVDNNDSKQDTQAARLAPEISNQIEEQASIGRTKYLNSSTKAFGPAKYMREWINRVERIGNLNYPDQARRQKLSGTLILDVVINANGELVKIDLRQSSGHQILDDAAKRIVKLAAPYSTFPKKLRQGTDVIHITRSWEFLNNNSLRTQ